MADDPAAKKMADDKAKLQKENEERAKARAAHEEYTHGTPTPTQEEANLLKMGNHVELAADGSGPDPYIYGHSKKESNPSGSGAGYQTRQSTPHATTSRHARSE
jgi:hypothetical protein